MSSSDPLIKAVLKTLDAKSFERVRKLLTSNATISQSTLNKALEILVVMAGSYDMDSPILINTLSMLLERGANPNKEINLGTTTPLEFAYNNRRTDVVRVLLEHGAEITDDLLDTIERQAVVNSTHPLYNIQLQIMNEFVKPNISRIAERQAANVLYRKFEKNTGQFVPENVAKYASKFMTRRSSSSGSSNRRRNVRKAINRQTAKKPKAVAGGGGN